MGAKIITEKDFWMCSSGAMPAQLQGTRTSNKKSSGEVYITVADTATSSWIDFGCTKNMLFAALIAAVVVVVVVALVVGTGGIAAIGLLGMMAIGAGAGIVGGVVAAVHGALKCGQKNAPQRSWSSSKQNMVLTGTPAITGAHTMTCKVGGTVTFAPEIKSWTHAIALGGLNYLTKFAECGLAGAAVGGGGYLFAGLASGSLALAWPSVPSVLGNVTGSFTGVWGASRALFGLDSLANEQAYGRVQDGGDALTAFGGGAVPEVGMAQRIFTGQAQPADYLIFLYLLNVKAGRNAPPVEERPANNGNEEGTPTDKDGNNTPEEEGSQAAPPKGENSVENNSQSKTGSAYEQGAKSREQLIAESREAYRKATDAHGQLPDSKKGKTTASDGINTVSGHAPNRISARSRETIGVTDVPPGDVMKRANDIAHDLAQNSSIDNGVPGQAAASHAEKQIMTAKPGDPIGVQRDMCSDCVEFAQKHANELGHDVVVTDPKGTKIFEPGGTEPIDIGWE